MIQNQVVYILVPTLANWHIAPCNLISPKFPTAVSQHVSMLLQSMCVSMCEMCVYVCVCVCVL